MKHTAEPWRLGRFTGPASYEEVREMCGAMDVVADTDDGPYVLAACNTNFPDDARANARRIVACVNVCAGLDTALIERIVSNGETLPRRLEAMTNWERCDAEKQRDELMLAANAVCEWHKNNHRPTNEHIDRLNNVIEKVGAGGTAPEGHNPS